MEQEMKEWMDMFMMDMWKEIKEEVCFGIHTKKKRKLEESNHD